MLTRLFPPLKFLNLPNIISTGTLFCGFTSFVLIAKGNLQAALFVFPLALLLDSLDGMAARKMQASSQFGFLLDSFCDVINFCITPAYMAYVLGFDSWYAVGLLLLHILGGVWRITYYAMIGTQDADSEPYFVGVTTNLSAALFFCGVSIMRIAGISNFNVFFVPFFPVMTFAMISSYKLKKYGFLTKFLCALMAVLLILNCSS